MDKAAATGHYFERVYIGEPGEAQLEPTFHVVEEGLVRVMNGKVVLNVLGPGDFWGEIVLLFGRASANIVIDEYPCVFWRLRSDGERGPRDCLSELLTRYPPLTLNLLEGMAWRLWRTEMFLPSRNARQRLRSYLAFANKAALHLTAAQIAEQIGLTPVAVRAALRWMTTQRDEAEQPVVQWGPGQAVKITNMRWIRQGGFYPPMPTVDGSPRSAQQTTR